MKIILKVISSFDLWNPLPTIHIYIYCFQVSYNLLLAPHIAPSYLACDVLGFRSSDAGQVAYFVIGLSPTTNVTGDVLAQTLVDSSGEDGRLYSEREEESITVNSSYIIFEGKTLEMHYW